MRVGMSIIFLGRGRRAIQERRHFGLHGMRQASAIMRARDGDPAFPHLLPLSRLVRGGDRGYKRKF